MVPSSNKSMLNVSVKPFDKFNRTSAPPPRRSSSRPRKPRATPPHRPSGNSCTPKETPPRRSSSRPRLQGGEDAAPVIESSVRRPGRKHPPGIAQRHQIHRRVPLVKSKLPQDFQGPVKISAGATPSTALGPESGAIFGEAIFFCLPFLAKRSGLWIF